MFYAVVVDVLRRVAVVSFEDYSAASDVDFRAVFDVEDYVAFIVEFYFVFVGVAVVVADEVAVFVYGEAPEAVGYVVLSVFAGFFGVFFCVRNCTVRFFERFGYVFTKDGYFL